MRIAPSGYSTFKKQPLSRRALRDAELVIEIERVFWDRKLGRGISGVRKIWYLLKREGIVMARCTVDRLMRQQGLRASDAGSRSSRSSLTVRRFVQPIDKTECVKIDGPFWTAEEFELATRSWVHWFNEDRLYSAIGYLTPVEQESVYYRESNSRSQPVLGELALY